MSDRKYTGKHEAVNRPQAHSRRPAEPNSPRAQLRQPMEPNRPQAYSRRPAEPSRSQTHSMQPMEPNRQQSQLRRPAEPISPRAQLRQPEASSRSQTHSRQPMEPNNSRVHYIKRRKVRKRNNGKIFLAACAVLIGGVLFATALVDNAEANPNYSVAQELNEIREGNINNEIVIENSSTSELLSITSDAVQEAVMDEEVPTSLEMTSAAKEPELILSCSEDLVEFLKRYEKYEEFPYYCAGDAMTIGYGHKILKGESFTSVSEAEATEIMHSDIKRETASLNRWIKENGIVLTQNQYDALASFEFNLGGGKVEEEFAECLTSGDYEGLKTAWVSYIKANGVRLKGLLLRRFDEMQMFFDGDYKRD